MHGMKYVLDLRMCAGGCFFNILGIGPIFDSMSPHFCSIKCIILCKFLFFIWILLVVCVLLDLWYLFILVSSICCTPLVFCV